jgi:hypothetical protein
VDSGGRDSRVQCGVALVDVAGRANLIAEPNILILEDLISVELISLYIRSLI